MLFGFCMLEEVIYFDCAGVRSCTSEGESRIEAVSG